MNEISTVVQALNALAHEARLQVFLELMEAGPAGLSAGALANRIDIPSNALSFHLTRLRHAGLLNSRREGQRKVYTACYEEMDSLLGFLTQHCCKRGAETCESVCKGQERDEDNLAASA